MYVTVKITDGRGRVKSERTVHAPREGGRPEQAAELARRATFAPAGRAAA